MTDRSSAFSRGPVDLSDTVRWLNVSGATVPAYGVVQFRSNFLSGYNQAEKPDSPTGLFFVNGPVDVLNGGYGESLLFHKPRLVLVSGSPTVGDTVGPSADSWEMSDTGEGFKVMHQPVSGVAAVISAGGGGSRRQVIFSEDLFAAVNTKRDPSFAYARVLRKKANGDLTLSTDSLYVTNRFKNISIDAGIYGKVEWLDGEWQPYAADCPGDSSSSGSGPV